MSIVIDSSIALAWLYPDEQMPGSNDIVDIVARHRNANA